jgi:hypothetical protein
MWSGLYRHHLIGFIGIVSHFHFAFSDKSKPSGSRDFGPALTPGRLGGQTRNDGAIQPT